ncbi:MAG TPA: sulfite exporter TauE/SafE family protein [Sphingomonadaceae bacterium]|nr:sulfite exporter TauE/SafE family protein [Sphingomonadaceae bacterium]
MSDLLTLALLAGASFLAALVSASLSVGGGYVLFGATTLLYPLPAAIALQPALSYASLVARAVTFRQAITWRIVRPFTLGSLVGVAAGLALYHTIPERALALGVGAMMLVLSWAQMPMRHIQSQPGMAGVGVAHGMSGTVLGMGSVLQPVLLNSGIDRRALVGTFASCLLVLEAIRAGGYAITGFAYAPYAAAIAIATVAGFAGTWCGKQLIGHIPEEKFRIIMRLLVSALALRLIWTGMMGAD